jgi:formylmethanofuran dehydrogenase subunit A
MVIKLAGGRVIDPANNRDATGDVYIANGRVIAEPPGGQADEVYDVSGKIVMAGAIDIHSHIAGQNVCHARQLLLDQHRGERGRFPGQPFATAKWSTYETGRLYAQMGYTTVVEPAMSPQNAVAAHLEMADIPYIDRAALGVLGNDDFALRLIRDGEESALRDYTAWTLANSKCMGVKVINAGGAAAFKENARTFGLDDTVPAYGVSSRRIFQAFQRAVKDLGIVHPVHLHANNLGVPGNFETALATMDAAGGLPLHMTHLQFYSYAKEGRRRFSSAAARLAEALRTRKNISIDVGQVMFRQTVTISADVMRQFNSRGLGSPKKWVIWDGDANGGGVVPYKYREASFHNAVQWAIGLELFLLIDDPWQVHFTTDHPNGAPFTVYPAVLKLLMDREARNRCVAELPKAAMEMTLLPQLAREYTLYEVAIMTRASPARHLGFADRGHLAPGAIGDVAVYTPQADIDAMFRSASLVFKDGGLIVRDGWALDQVWGKTQRVAPSYDRQIEKRIASYYEQYFGLGADAFAAPNWLGGAGVPGGGDLFREQPCGK